MRKRFLNTIVVLVITLITNTITAQSDSASSFRRPIKKAEPKEKKEFENFKDRLYFGGNIGGGVYQNVTFFNISPIVGIKITKPFSVGLGFTYNYQSEKVGAKKYESKVYGSNVYARYFVYNNLFVQAGWDRLNVPDYTLGFFESRAWVDNILIGGGYRQQFAQRASFVAMVFYNINQTPLSPYTNPIIQIGFNVGL